MDPVRYARILVATDLSPASEEAIRQADRIARAHKAELRVVHVFPNHIGAHPLFSGIHKATSANVFELREGVKTALDAKVAALTGRKKGEVGVSFEEGIPAARIVAVAESWPADLVVVASHGRSGWRRMVLGGVAERVVRLAPCPVLVARRSPEKGAILAATDFSDPSIPAVAAAASFASTFGRPLAVLHSTEAYRLGTSVVAIGPVPEAIMLPVESLDQLRKDAGIELDRVLAQCGTPGEKIVSDGPPGGAILEAADSLPAELIVLGTIGRTGLSRLLMGNVAESVVSGAPCSVLVVRLNRTG